MARATGAQRKVWKTMKEAAAGLSEFEKERRRGLAKAVRDVAVEIAKAARTTARGLKLVQDARRHNKAIKLIVTTHARYSESKRQVKGGVAAFGLIAKIEQGKRARQFWLNENTPSRTKRKQNKRTKSGAKGFRFKGSRGWISVGEIFAGGQRFKTREIVKMTGTQRSNMKAAIDASMQKAAEDKF